MERTRRDQGRRQGQVRRGRPARDQREHVVLRRHDLAAQLRIPSPRTSMARRPAEVPAEALAASLGCGNPTALAELRPGEVVLDLGSGGGIDVLALRPAGRAGGQGVRARHDRRDARPGPGESAQGGRHQRRVPQGGDRAHAAAGRGRGRDHLQLRDQPLAGQGRRPGRGLPGPEARRPVRGLRRGGARGGAGRRAQEHGALDRLHRRRPGGVGVPRQAAEGGLRGDRRRADARLQRRERPRAPVCRGAGCRDHRGRGGQVHQRVHSRAQAASHDGCLGRPQRRGLW